MMKMLLDFLNVKEWTLHSLREFWLSNPLAPEPYIFTKYRPNGIPDSKQVVIWLEELKGGSFLGEDRHIIKAGETDCLPFYKYLETGQAEWTDRLQSTIEKGPDRMWLTQTLMKDERILYQETDDPWRLKIGIWTMGMPLIEHRLILSYKEPFIDGTGEQYRKIRQCRKPDCKKWFVYNRPKQKFCSNKCRLDFHNAIYKKDGSAAAHQRKGRAEKPDIYLK